ncbi:MAG: hypothetical protein ACE5HI_00625, partial [bacterium]
LALDILGLIVDTITTIFVIIGELVDTIVFILDIFNIGSEKLKKSFAELTKTGGPVGLLLKGMGRIKTTISDIIENVRSFKDLQDANVVSADLINKIKQGTLKLEKDILKILREQGDLSNVKLTGTTVPDIEGALKSANDQLRLSRTVGNKVRNIFETIRAVSDGAIAPGFERALERLANLGEAGGGIKNLKTQVSILLELLDKLITLQPKVKDAFGSSSDEVLRLKEAIGEVSAEILRLVRITEIKQQLFVRLFDTSLANIAEIFRRRAIDSVVTDLFDAIINKTNKFSISFRKIMSSLKDFITSKEGIVQIVLALGNALANLFENLFRGTEGIGKAIKRFFVEILTMIGKFLIAVGTAAVALGLIGLFGFGVKHIVAGLKAIAVGVGILALAASIGGGSGAGSAVNSNGSVGSVSNNGENENRPAPTFISQKDINVQQGLTDALNANTDAITSLNKEVERLSREEGDVLVSRIIRQNPRLITSNLTKLAMRSFATSRGMGAAIIGENV